jgi:hypothetical protein
MERRALREDTVWERAEKQKAAAPHSAEMQLFSAYKIL